MVIGIDEVGRGCWAGPLVVAGVALSGEIAGLRDSKKLSLKQRIELEKLVFEHAARTSIAWIYPKRIDEIGLTAAMEEACEIVFSEICNENADTILIDGNTNYLKNRTGVRTVIGGDDLEPPIMAASIIAKQARDNYMAAIAETYPEYGFQSHVGYGTKKHSDALAQFGVTEIHRRSFKPIKRYIAESGEYRRA